MSNAPDSVLRLVERFERNADAYHAGGYGETQVRVEFIDPLFIALGWDVHNRAGYAQAYKDVVHEDAIKVGGSTKAPDYCFRIGGTRKFFLEAKKPSVDIAAEAHPAYQLRRYAWSAKLPLSILTDFEEFSVYDCRVRPKSTDKPSVGRVKYLTCREYGDRWDEIAAIFSKEAVLQGSFDKYVAGKKKRGTAEVDAEFLKDIETWRSALARNIALRNRTLDRRQLNVAVQRTIDRIIFLRICEDRGVEKYAALQALINGPDVYARLMQMFRAADDRYNSGLFHFNPERGRPADPDTLTPSLKIDDKVLKDVFRSLYYPQSPYEFSVLPPDILGNVYEQFLGKVIHLTPGRRVRVEEKPEVKKAGGVYYTPRYIVDYIVEHTVGKLLGSTGVSPVEGSTGVSPVEGSAGVSPVEGSTGVSPVEGSTGVSPVRDKTMAGTAMPQKGKTPRQINRMRVLDPACGSGSFLIGAYRKLLDYHRDWYLDENNGGPKKHTKQIYQGAGGQWYLTTAEKKRILLNNIYGVDIDPQAVEVSKLNLLLCVLENENQNTLSTQLKIFHERALPDLSNNIKCGNSLIGPDFYEGKQLALFDEETRYRVNAFDWQAEFPEIFKGKTPGFHAVIGNPPYVRVRIFKELHREEAEYMEAKYTCATHVWDIYLLFFERALEVIRTGGHCGLILPIQTLHQPNCESLRRLLFEKTNIHVVADLSQIKVFHGAIVKNCIIVAEKGHTRDHGIDVVAPRTAGELIFERHYNWPQKDAETNPAYSLKTDLLSPKKDLCDKIRTQSWLLSDLFYVTFGLRSCAKGKGQGGKERLITSQSDAPKAKPYLEGRDIARYKTQWPGRYIKYIREEMYSPRAPELFENKKVISQTMLSKMRLVATLDTEGYYVEQSLLCIIPHGMLTEKRDVPDYPLEFVLGILNSKLASFYFGAWIIDYSLGGGLIHATPGSQGKLLIPKVGLPGTESIACAAQSTLSLHKQLSAARTDHDKTLIQRQIASTDKQIDKLVYELYGLTEEEIEIVKESK